MGTYFTRTRAWVYIAFYDQYVGRHINTSAGLSILFMIPCYWYGQRITRSKEYVARNYLYFTQYFPMRSRLLHNMIMEQFEMHVETMQDIILDVQKNGQKAFDNIQKKKFEEEPFRLSDDDESTISLLQDISGFSGLIDNYTNTNPMPEASKERLRAMIVRSTPEAKSQAKYNLHVKRFGTDR